MNTIKKALARKYPDLNKGKSTRARPAARKRSNKNSGASGKA
jgi:hypothetical protein